MFFYFSLPLLSYIAFFVSITKFLFFLKIVGFFESVILLKNTFMFKTFSFFLTQVQSNMNQVFILLNFFSDLLSILSERERQRERERERKRERQRIRERERETKRKRNCLTILKNICLGIAFYNKTTRGLNIF